MHQAGRLLVIVTALAASGCSTVVRENIISTVNTGFGLQLAENPSTQLYELKLGYLRNQFYSIPTTKQVDGTNRMNSISDKIGTPQLVSGMGGSATINGRSFGGGMAENFAVGETGVTSAAAMMMYMSTAKDVGTAQAMADAIQALHDAPPRTNRVGTARTVAEGLLRKDHAEAGQ